MTSRPQTPGTHVRKSKHLVCEEIKVQVIRVLVARYSLAGLHFSCGRLEDRYPLHLDDPELFTPAYCPEFVLRRRNVTYKMR